jgi:hypothetical protein
MFGMSRTFPIAGLLLAACSSAPPLEKAEELAPKTVATSPEDVDACLLSTTGADRNGVRLPKAAVKAVKAELKDRRIDCSAYETGQSEARTAGGAMSPPVSFDEGGSPRLPEKSHQSAD